MTTTKTQQYDQFSLDYHWLFSDRVLSGEPFLEQYKNLLESLPSDSKILDCACGIGTDALTLARRGFSVQGTDSSLGMVEQARERARYEELDISFTHLSWTDLTKAFRQEFDVVFCTGNAIGHCRDKEEMLASLRGIRGTLKKKGLLVLDSRNWEKLHAEKPRFTTFGVRVRNGVRCIPLYVWNFPCQWQDEHLIEVVLIFEEDGRVYQRHYSITYHQISHLELCDRLKEVGFKNIQSDFKKDKYSYIIKAWNS